MNKKESLNSLSGISMGQLMPDNIKPGSEKHADYFNASIR